MQLQLLQFHHIQEKKYPHLKQNNEKVLTKYVVIFELQTHMQGLIYLSHNIKESDQQLLILININYYYQSYYEESEGQMDLHLIS